MYISFKSGQSRCTALVERVILKQDVTNNWELTIWTVGLERPIKKLKCADYEEALLKYDVFTADLNAIDVGEEG